MTRTAALLAAAALLAGAAPPGASSCTGCHGGSAGLPSIAGRPAPDLAAAMLAFRDGSRPATLMDRLMKGFSPEEIQALAAYWSEAKP